MGNGSSIMDPRSEAGDALLRDTHRSMTMDALGRAHAGPVVAIGRRLHGDGSGGVRPSSGTTPDGEGLHFGIATVIL